MTLKMHAPKQSPPPQVKFKVLSRNDLIAMKKASGRPQDLENM